MTKISSTLWALAGLAIAGSCWGNGGHFRVDDASIGPAGTCDLETWASRREATDIDTATLNPECNFTGAAEWSVPLVYDLTGDEFTHAGLEYKRVLGSLGGGPALAVDIGGKYNLVAGKFDRMYVNVPISLQLLDNLTFHANVGGVHDRPARETFGTWGLAATVTTVNGPKLIVEALDNEREESVVALGARFGLGTTWWTLDIGVARETGPGENIYTLGLNSPHLF